MEQDGFTAAINALDAAMRRHVVRIQFLPCLPMPTLYVTLGCGHEVSSRDANTRRDLWDLELGDEMDCPHCLSSVNSRA